MKSEQNKRVMMLTHEIQEVVDELIKRSPSAIATALVFTMAEVINNNKEVTTLDEINELLAVAGVESLMLVDGVFMASSNTNKKVLH